MLETDGAYIGPAAKWKTRKNTALEKYRERKSNPLPTTLFSFEPSKSIICNSPDAKAKRPCGAIYRSEQNPDRRTNPKREPARPPFRKGRRTKRLRRFPFPYGNRGKGAESRSSEVEIDTRLKQMSGFALNQLIR